jgi:serine/threonine-protein kinase HipA
MRRSDRSECRNEGRYDLAIAPGLGARRKTAKYESNQTGICGPTLKDMFELTRRHMLPNDIVRLLDLIIFNVLVCNTDAHAKNYSIMLRGNGASLAPMYDVMCGEVWENVTKNMVQKIGHTRLADQLTGRHWQQLARECGLNPGEGWTGSPRWQNRSSQKRR